MTLPFTCQWRRPVPQIAATEDLQTAGSQLWHLSHVRRPIQHACNIFQGLVALSDMAGTFESTATFGVLGCVCCGEAIRLEMPREPVAFFGLVDNDVSRWVCTAVEFAYLQTVFYQFVEAKAILSGPKRTVLGVIGIGAKKLRLLS